MNFRLNDFVFLQSYGSCSTFAYERSPLNLEKPQLLKCPSQWEARIAISASVLFAFFELYQNLQLALDNVRMLLLKKPENLRLYYNRRFTPSAEGPNQTSGPLWAKISCLYIWPLKQCQNGQIDSSLFQLLDNTTHIAFFITPFTVLELKHCVQRGFQRA